MSSLQIEQVRHLVMAVSSQTRVCERSSGQLDVGSTYRNSEASGDSRGSRKEIESLLS